MGKLEGCHKIGRSTAPVSRLTVLSNSPVPLRIIASIQTNDAAWLERYLHIAYAHCRKRSEWFALDNDEIATLQSIRYVGGVSDLPQLVVSSHAINHARLNPVKTPRAPGGVGRPRTLPDGARRRSYRVSDEEHKAIKRLLKELRVKVPR